MHDVKIRSHIVERVMARRKRLHLFDRLDPKRTALVVVDMQNLFCEPGAPAEVPAARGIVPNINRLADEVRKRAGKVIWVMQANVSDASGSDWSNYINVFLAADMRERTLASLAPGSRGQSLWNGMDAQEGDLRVLKNRYSPLIPGSSQLERILRSHGIENLLIAGTKTNVCCESTARDAMMLDFKVVMVSDCLAALSDDEHLATLETMIQQFADVRSSQELFAIL